MPHLRALFPCLLAAALGCSGIPLALGDETTPYIPTAQYASRVAAAFKRNLVYTEPLATTKGAEVEITATADGNILNRRLLKSSGEPSWDDAALQAVDKTKRLPMDSNGRVPPIIVIVFMPTNWP